jgi:hypothetical protein
MGEMVVIVERNFVRSLTLALTTNAITDSCEQCLIVHTRTRS